MFFLQLVKSLWPFIKEMSLGDITILEALVNNRKKLLFICLIFGSIGLNITTVNRLLTLSKQYMALNGDYVKYKFTHRIASFAGSKVSSINNDLITLAETENNNCRKYILPKLPAKPELPINEINKLNDDDTEKLSIIEKNYIITLYKYIDDLKKVINNSYNDYSINCIDNKK